ASNDDGLGRRVGRRALQWCRRREGPPTLCGPGLEGFPVAASALAFIWRNSDLCANRITLLAHDDNMRQKNFVYVSYPCDFGVYFPTRHGSNWTRSNRS